MIVNEQALVARLPAVALRPILPHAQYSPYSCLLFLAMAKADLSWSMFRWRHLLLSVPAPVIALTVFYLTRGIDPNLALNLFLVFVAPAAAITPVMVDLLRRDVPYALGGVLVTHGVWAFLMAGLLPVVGGFSMSAGQIAELLLQVSVTVGVPLALAIVWRSVGGRLLANTLKLGRYSLYLFVFNIFIASARLAQYLKYEATIDPLFLAQVAVGVVVGGALLFTAGYFTGRRGHRPEASLIVGRKNTMLSIWIALTFLSPLITIGPMLYILFQNVLFAGQLRWWGKEEVLSS